MLITQPTIKTPNSLENITYNPPLVYLDKSTDSTTTDMFLSQVITKNRNTNESTTEISYVTVMGTKKSETELKELAWNFLDLTYHNSIIDKEFSRIETQKITTTEITPLIYIPLREDFLLDESTDLQVIPIHAGMIFQVSNILNIRTTDNIELKLGLIDNTYNYFQTGVAAVLLEICDLESNSIRFAEIVNISSPIVTYIGTKDDIYPNKIENILIALQQISVKQEKMGGFKQGQNYSYLNLVGLEKGSLYSIYKDGLNKYHNPIRANGICAIATGISALLCEKNYEPQLIQERWLHRDMYHQGPFSPVRKQVDAAIEFGPDAHQNYDLKWIQQADEYLSINVDFFPTGLEFSETRADGKAGPSDVGLILSLSFSPDYLEQSKQIELLLNNFQKYRESKHLHALSQESSLNEVVYRNLSDKNYSGWAKTIYDAKSPSFFADTIRDNRSLQNIIQLSNTVNAYSEGSESLFTFLKNSEWYTQFKNMSLDKSIDIDKALLKGTCLQIQGQPLQCIGFAMILTNLYPELGFPNISGATADMAGKLVPDFVYGIEGQFSTGYGETALVGKSLTIDDYSPGDFYVIKGTPGHVGAVLAKKGEVLLVADSNRLWDGRVNIFYVDARNFDAVFGEEKYIVLGHFDPTSEYLSNLTKMKEMLKKQNYYAPFLSNWLMNYVKIQ